VLERLFGRSAGSVFATLSRGGAWRRFAVFFALIGPGIITSNVDNDAGGITTYSLAGAEYGLSLLWTLIPITAVLIIIQEMGPAWG
jgi:Mn2+/Fe2+ NRAMP family transporter